MSKPNLNLVDLATWKAAAQAGQPIPVAVLRKQYVAEQVKTGEGDGRKVTFIITTGVPDRDRDTLSVDGWKVENYLKNPVVLWAHNYRSLPVGKAESVVKTGGVLKATAEFATAEEYAFADTVYRLIKGGYLRATSVGFNPLKYVWNEERRGYDFQEQELLEFSVVPVPANPEALLDAKSAGIELSPLKAWAEEVLDDIDGPGLWVPRAQALKVFDLLKAPMAPVPAPADAPPAPAPEKDIPPAPPAPEQKAFVPTPEEIRAAMKAALSEKAQETVDHLRGRLT